MSSVISLVNDINPNFPDVYYLKVKCSNVLRVGCRLLTLDAPAFPKRMMIHQDGVSLVWEPSTPPILLSEFFDQPSYNVDEVSSKWIPQLISGLIHAHSRNLAMVTVSPHVIGVHGDRAYYLDISNSVFQLSEMQIENSVNLDAYSAPETVYHKKITSRTDVYGLCLTWICMSERQTIEAMLPERTTQTIHAHAISKASDFQKQMLQWKWIDRPSMDTVYHNQPKYEIPFTRNPYWTAVDACFKTPAEGYSMLYQIPKFTTYLPEIRNLLPALLLHASKSIENSSTSLMTPTLRTELESFMKFLVALSSADSSAKSSDKHTYLCRLKQPAETINLYSLMAHFIKIDAQQGLSLLKEFEKAKVMTITDDFVLELYNDGIPEKAESEFYSMAKATATGRALQAAQAHWKSSYERIILEMREELTSKDQKLEDQRGDLKRQAEDIEKLKEELEKEKGYNNDINDDITNIINKMNKREKK